MYGYVRPGNSQPTWLFPFVVSVVLVLSVLPLATLWRIARRDLATRIRGLRLLAVCLFLGVATLATIGSLTASITGEISARGQVLLGGDVEVGMTQRQAAAYQYVVCLARLLALSGRQNEFSHYQQRNRIEVAS